MNTSKHDKMQCFKLYFDVFITPPKWSSSYQDIVQAWSLENVCWMLFGHDCITNFWFSTRNERMVHAINSIKFSKWIKYEKETSN